MASKETWEKLKHFKKIGSDNWGDPDALADDVLIRLDAFRNYLNVPFYVTSGVRPETDGKTSYHTRSKGACAVDIMCPEYAGHPIDLIFAALRFGFNGVGYYPDWQWKGLKCGGLHLDTRPLGITADGSENYAHSQWMAILVKGVQTYIPLTYANLIRNIKGDVK